MPPLDSDHARWFAEHVQPHEAMVRGWWRGRLTSENARPAAVAASPPDPPRP